MGRERSRMVSGQLYDPDDPELVALRRRARGLLYALNQAGEEEKERRADVLARLLGGVGTGVWIEPPFFCDYGENIFLGARVYFNFNCVVLDSAPVTIGDDVLFGPAVQIYTPLHPMDPVERRTRRESAKPVTIGSDVWVGGGAIFCPGVTIGKNSVIGAGSVVTRDVPEGVFAAGNPCRVIRPVDAGR